MPGETLSTSARSFLMILRGLKNAGGALSTVSKGLQILWPNQISDKLWQIGYPVLVSSRNRNVQVKLINKRPIPKKRRVLYLLSSKSLSQVNGPEFPSGLSFGEQSPATGERQHIQFNDKVGQFIAVDTEDGDDDEDEWKSYPTYSSPMTCALELPQLEFRGAIWCATWVLRKQSRV